MQIYVPAILVAVLLAWLCTDRVVYRGKASVFDNNNMKHYSTTHKTVIVVPHTASKTSFSVLVATVTNARAAEFAASPTAKCNVTVRRRLFGAPRVTRIS